MSKSGKTVYPLPETGENNNLTAYKRAHVVDLETAVQQSNSALERVLKRQNPQESPVRLPSIKHMSQPRQVYKTTNHDMNETDI